MQCAPLNWIATYICKSCNLQFSHHLPLSLPPSHSVARGFEKRSLQRPELVNCHQCKIFWSGLHIFFILALSHSRWLISAHSGSFQVTLAHPGLPWLTLALSSSLWLTLAQSLALSGAQKVLAWPPVYIALINTHGALWPIWYCASFRDKEIPKSSI